MNAPVSFCDACQRKNQNCRSHVIVGGLRYEKDTHEPIDSDSESDSDSNDSHPSSSAKTSAKREFNMGMCWGNVQADDRSAMPPPGRAVPLPLALGRCAVLSRAESLP